VLDAGGRLIVVGYGNMGKALVAGLVKAELVNPADVVAIDPDATDVGVTIVRHVNSAAPLRDGDAIILAVKPQVFPAVAPDLARALTPLSKSGAMVLSIMAGVTSHKIADLLGPKARVVRAMPNTPAQLGLGATAFALGPSATEGDGLTASNMLAALGPLVIWIDESLMDAFTAVAGSGPAYLFHLAESMTAGAIAAGFDPATADRIVRQTLAGSAALLAAEAGTSPADLRARVTSKGGTTEAALNVLTQAEAYEAMVAAVVAARDRGRELGKR
jgi:pyrroline-5-carboxylate reductase